MNSPQSENLNNLFSLFLLPRIDVHPVNKSIKTGINFL